MNTPKQYIPGLVAERSYPYSPKQFLNVVKDHEHSDAHRDRTLRDCHVDEVIHLRRESSTLMKVPHEIILVCYSHTVIDANGATACTDVRVAKIERLKYYRSGAEDGSLGSVPLYTPARRASRDSKGVATGNLDRVLVGEKVAELAYGYERVGSFTPAQGSLNIVDCAVAAHTITERAEDYSTLQYMCMWYARMLFESLRRLAGTPTTQEGPAYKRAGMWRKARMVTAEGRLVLDARPSDLVSGVLGGAGDTQEREVRDAIERDRAVDSQGSEPLREVQEDIEVCRTETWRVIGEGAAAAYERIHREDILKAENARKDAELAERVHREGILKVENARKDIELARARDEAARNKAEAARNKAEAARKDDELARLRAQLAQVQGADPSTSGQVSKGGRRR
ncbi:hypothetical protein BD626DRAFT_568474 [Schizophyllum amplum]|uniref:Uncharacterized protein n=1 Tax=Schizophyllum amplum TaxID=97359 RepID=A0A550CGC2_9AGAR|nr:hypothetical protein BD626DRAFT_568474 [Auriculariopsis ampla]